MKLAAILLVFCLGAPVLADMVAPEDNSLERLALAVRAVLRFDFGCSSPVSVYRYFFNPERSSLICDYRLSSPATFAPLTFWAYLLILISTILLEGPIYAVGSRFFAPKAKRTGWHCFRSIVILNLATHPAVVFVFGNLAMTYGWREASYLAIAESFAIVVEAILLWRPYRFHPMAAFTLALLANLLSWTVGGLISI